MNWNQFKSRDILYDKYLSLWQRANTWNVRFFALYDGQFMFSTQLLTLNYQISYLFQFLMSAQAQADYTMCLWLIVVVMRWTKSMRVVNKALKMAYLNYFCGWVWHQSYLESYILHFSINFLGKCGAMKPKFGKEIEQHLIHQKAS